MVFSKVFIGVLFLFVWIADLISSRDGYEKGITFAKPLLMPLLVILYLLIAKTPVDYIVVALMFGFLGDVFLMWKTPKIFFALGLGAFLIGHIFYIITFAQTTDCYALVPGWFYVFVLPYLLYGGFMYAKLKDSLGMMKIPALVYMLALLTMSFTSLTRVWGCHGWMFVLPFIGSLIFVASDSILSINVFVRKTKNGEFWIMFTYVLAQLLIALGFAL